MSRVTSLHVARHMRGICRFKRLRNALRASNTLKMLKRSALATRDYQSHLDTCYECEMTGHCDKARELRREAYRLNAEAVSAIEVVV